MLQDITNRKELEEKLNSLARLDDLTRLINRREFDSLFELALARVERSATGLALLFLDLDGFKKVNDTLGHEAGDEVLKITAKRLLKQIRKTDVAGRMGGDEFTIILESNLTRKNLILIVERILKSISTPFPLSNDQSAQLSCSIGIALAPDEGLDIKQLYAVADAAMYKAKNLGKNQFYIGTD